MIKVTNSGVATPATIIKTYENLTDEDFGLFTDKDGDIVLVAHSSRDKKMTLCYLVSEPWLSTDSSLFFPLTRFAPGRSITLTQED